MKASTSLVVPQMLNRLSPEVVEIVRLDLIQKVGDALRYPIRKAELTQEFVNALRQHAANEKRRVEELEDFLESEFINKPMEWGDW